jgi:hypothetical protein
MVRQRRRVTRARHHLCLAIVLTAPSVARAQTASPTPTPTVVTSFLERIGPRPTAEAYHEAAKDALWSVYPLGDSGKKPLVDYVSRERENPGIAFAAMALIAFHDPATVRSIVQRALDSSVTPSTRWYLLNAAPYVLAIGDAMYMGDGQLDSNSTEFARYMLALADSAVLHGLGRAHARNLRHVYDTADRTDSDYGLAVWHLSAYLVGTLDLRDRQTLDVFMTAKDGRRTFANVMDALSFATGRDFLRDLRNKSGREITPRMEARTAEAARAWWRDYLAAHPDGDWRPATRESLARAGYALEADPRSAVSRAALRRAVEAPSPITRYAAYRMLNDTYGTNFDLQPIFMSGKYALSFLDPIEQKQAQETRLRTYWKTRLQ